MIVPDWIWKSAVAGVCGTIVHFLFMQFKSQTGLLATFQPYASLQTALNQWLGKAVPAIVPWALSFINGSTILALLFHRIYGLLPGRHGAMKGLAFGLFGWVGMGLIFFPLIGLGPFALHVGLGIKPALLSLAMLLAYSVAMGTVYGQLTRS